MAENLVSEGKLVTLVNATAASNIAAGIMVGVNTGVNTIYSLSRETTGLAGTGGTFGCRFLGVLDATVSGGQSPITVWAEGVFRFQLATAISTAAFIGMPVYAPLSGAGDRVGTVGDGPLTGSLPIGTVVGVSTANAGNTSGGWVDVRIMPGAYRWGIYGRADAIATGNALVEHGDVWPPVM